MANIKISAAADAGTLLSSDMLPLARSGDTNAYHATMAEISTFASATVSSGAYGNIGRNLIHNSMFNVEQRGRGPFTIPTPGNAYTADRWQVSNIAVGDSNTVGINLLTDSNRAQIGDEAATNVMANTFTGGGGAGNACIINQNIEGVRRLAGKTVTVSFYATASAALRLGISVDQYFGTGGPASASVFGTGQAVTLSTTFSRYSMTFTLPSAAGKTIGTNGNDYTPVNVWLSAGSNFGTRSGNVGAQTGTVFLWGVQLEIGTQATPLEKLDPRIDLANCQRFYFFQPNFSVGGYNTPDAIDAYQIMLPVTMRASPTITPTFSSGINTGTLQFQVPSGTMANLTANPFATGAFSFVCNFTASADL